MNINKISSNPIRLLAKIKDPKILRQKLNAISKTMGVVHFQKRAALEIVNHTQPERAIPEVYQPYRALVRDGIQFFLSHISFHRLLDLITHQLQMPEDSSPEERLLELAKSFPTLHKLGQIIARNQYIDPDVKRWLVHLENGQYGTAADDLLTHISSRLGSGDEHSGLQIDRHILAEASVGAVIPFHWKGKGSANRARGVFKVLKPNIHDKLDEELAVFEKMAVFFEDHRHDYELKDFRFLEVFNDVRQILEKEIDLSAEHSHLSQASLFYAYSDDIVIPELMSLSDESMTAMTYIGGEKITEADMTEIQRQACAQVLAESLICRPLFATEEPALFHGDPHAGNILWTGDNENHWEKIALLDWSLAGHLTRHVRIKIVQLIKSVIIDDASQIGRSLQNLAKDQTRTGPLSRTKLWRLVVRLKQSETYIDYPLLKKALWLLEQLSYEGVVFPSDLMLFRKAIFTLDGVLFDLDPRFNMDTFVFKYMAGLLAEEMPRRFGNVLFFQKDKPENYQSLLSNSDLQLVMLNQYTAALKRQTNAAVELIEKQAKLMRRFFN